MYWKEICHECPSRSQQCPLSRIKVGVSPETQFSTILDSGCDYRCSHVQRAHSGPQCFSWQLQKKKKKSPNRRSWLYNMSYKVCWINSSFFTAITELLRLEGSLDILQFKPSAQNRTNQSRFSWSMSDKFGISPISPQMFLCKYISL